MISIDRLTSVFVHSWVSSGANNQHRISLQSSTPADSALEVFARDLASAHKVPGFQSPAVPSSVQPQPMFDNLLDPKRKTYLQRY